MSGASPSPRRPLPAVPLLFLLHLYAWALLLGGICLSVLQPLLFESYYYASDESVLVLLGVAAAAAWVIFLIRGFHTRAATIRRRCRIFCWAGLILGILFLLALGVLSGLLGSRDARLFSFFGLAELTFYATCLYYFSVSAEIDRAFNPASA